MVATTGQCYLAVTLHSLEKARRFGFTYMLGLSTRTPTDVAECLLGIFSIEFKIHLKRTLV